MVKTANYKNNTITAIGLFFIVIGVIGIYIFVFQGIKPEYLKLNVFTFYSKYLDAKYFTIIQNNQGDEIAIICYCIGWFLIYFKDNKSFLSKQSLAIILFAIGYLFFHGFAVIYYLFSFLFVLPFIFIKRQHYESFYSIFKR